MIAFWKKWTGEATCMGPKPDFMTGKALMAAMGMTGISAHADDIYAELTGNPEIWNVFESLEGKAASRAATRTRLSRCRASTAGNERFAATSPWSNSWPRCSPVAESASG